MKLTRMTLGSIDNLLDSDNSTRRLGEGIILAGRWLPRSLTISYAGTVIKKELSESTMQASNGAFLEMVEKFLKEERLYVAEVEYRPKKWDGAIPHKINGIFYREL